MEAPRRLRLLSLDGGGIRGLSSLLILERIMQYIKEEQHLSAVPKPCEYFDMIAGTSTGGLMALMLGRLQMDVDSCIKTYCSLAEDIFPEDKRILLSQRKKLDFVRGKPWFDAKSLEKSLQDVIKQALGDPTALMIDPENTLPKCKVFVCAMHEKQTTPFIFRTYSSKDAARVTRDAKIWEAGRATTAAPVFFAPIQIGDLGGTFADGGLRNNNPIQELKKEARRVWPNADNYPWGVFVSIGTGEQTPKDLGPGVEPLIEALTSIVTDARQKNLEFVTNNPDLKPDKLFRFNVLLGMDDIGMERWQEKASIEAATERYLMEDPAVSDVLAKCVGRLREGAGIGETGETLSQSRGLVQNDEVNEGEIFSSRPKAWMSSNSTKVVLEMLDFPRMNRRHEEVSETYENTFSWILHRDTSYEDGEPDLGMRHQHTRAGFVSWLREGSGIYWINGKPGSGKSTLMKLIRGNPQTDEHLRHWAGNIPLVIGHFYFHDRGNDLEKSQIGLFRALLLQIFKACPLLIPEAFAPSWGRLRKFRVLKRPIKEEFSREELLAAFRSILTMKATTLRLCFFIDGLDEYEGHDREIAGLLMRIHSQGPHGHKMCLSSRPHAAFEAAFAKYPNLKLHDLTYNDIYIYVYGQLRSHSRYVENEDHNYMSRFDTIVENVVQKSRGVFLWVRLAVMSLLDGLDEYDWIHELEERVEALPPELEAFYDRMLRMIDRSYRHQASRIFRIMLDSESPPHCVTLSFAERYDGDIF
ncbi:hypothetical protein AUP68_00648 [Ilyonectria robusta]